MTRDFMKPPPSVVNPRHPTEKIALHRGGKKKILKRCKNNTICEPGCRQQTLHPSNNKLCHRTITQRTVKTRIGGWIFYPRGSFRRVAVHLPRRFILPPNTVRSDRQP